MRRALLAALLLAAAGVVFVLGTGAGEPSGGNYKVRAIFDNASFVVTGEDVKVAGVKVGTIESLDVTKDKKAAVVLDVTDKGFADFRKDAHCTIRPQSLIGEQFVECSPTQPVAPGQQHPPALAKVPKGQPGAGQHLLPVQNTSSPVGIDLVGDNLRLTQRQRLSLIINELGTGLAGNGQELHDVIRRADPALANLDRVLKILGSQNRQLASLARDSDTTFAPLARDKQRVADFITKAKNTAVATAERRGDLERNFEKLPTFLTELRLTAPKLINFSNQAEPVLADLHAHAAPINTLIEQLGPFSKASRPAFRSLGKAGNIGGPALKATRPLARTFNSLGLALRPVAKTTNALLQNFYKSGGIEGVMRYIFFQDAAVNGYDSVSHYLRAGLITSGLIQCSSYATNNDPSCSANFTPSVAARRHISDAEGRRLFLAQAAKDGLLGKKPTASIAASKGGSISGNGPAESTTTATPPASPSPSSSASPGASSADPTGSASSGADDANGLLQYLLGSGGQ